MNQPHKQTKSQTPTPSLHFDVTTFYVLYHSASINAELLETMLYVMKPWEILFCSIKYINMEYMGNSSINCLKYYATVTTYIVDQYSVLKQKLLSSPTVMM